EDIFFEVFKEEMKDWFYSFSQPYIDQNVVLHHFDRLQKNILIKKLLPYMALHLAQDTNELNRFFHSHLEILSQKLSKDMSKPAKHCKSKFLKTFVMVFGFMGAENLQLLNSASALSFDTLLQEIWNWS
ncbi:hypothetical protein EB169_03840, partial [archaeon]|nr:hypothetical protein [archaeon]